MEKIDDKYDKIFEDKKKKDLPDLDYRIYHNNENSLNRERNKTEFRKNISVSIYTAPQQTESCLYTHNSFIMKEPLQKTSTNFSSNASSNAILNQKKYFFKILFCLKSRKKISAKNYLKTTLSNHLATIFLHFIIFLFSLLEFEYSKNTSKSKNDEDFHFTILLYIITNFFTLMYFCYSKGSFRKLRSKKHYTKVKNCLLAAYVENGVNILGCFNLGIIYLVFFRVGNWKNEGFHIFLRDGVFCLVPLLLVIWDLFLFYCCCEVFEILGEIGKDQKEGKKRGEVLDN